MKSVFSSPALEEVSMATIHCLSLFIAMLCCVNSKSLRSNKYDGKSTKSEERTALKEELTGVDCSKPTHLQKMSVNIHGCEARIEEEKLKETAEFAILEKRNFFDVKGKSCSGRVSTFQFQCWQGAFVAEQRWASIPNIHLKYEISADECRKMHDRRFFKDKRGTKHSLEVNEENVIKYTSHGLIYSDHWNQFCKGEDILKNGNIEDKIVEMEILSITLNDDISIRFNEEKTKIEDLNANREISCKAKENGCGVGLVTYVWVYPKETCNVVLLKSIKGHWSTGRFVSQEEGIILNVKTDMRPSGCNFMSKPTEFENIFLVDSLNLHSVTDSLLPFQADDINLPEFIEERDSFLKWQLEEERLDHINTQLKNACVTKKEDQEKEIVINQDSGVILPTKTIGIFTRAKGEALEEFKCSVVTVKPRQINHCTNDLPVTYDGKDLFLTPITRILSETSSVQPCSRLGAPEFVTESGR